MTLNIPCPTKVPGHFLALIISLLFWGVSSAEAEQKDIYPISKTDISFLSDGTRVSATLFVPKQADSTEKLPAIAMAHGWGGEANHLFRYAKKFAERGIFVLVFDYRGWGESDSRLINVKNPNSNGYETIEYKGLIDPLDQAEDYFSALNWLATDTRVDPNRIGLWGTSWSGGTIVYVAARDHRVKALVSQASPIGWAGDWGQIDHWLEVGGERARGNRTYPKPFKKEIGNLRGAMVYEKLARFKPRDDASSITNCASLFVVVENEELFDNTKTSLVAHKRVRGITDYVVLPDASHYSIYYGKHLQMATDLATDWFLKHL